MTQFFWDQGQWDGAEWAGTAPPDEGWANDWRWWYQTATTVNFELNGLLVEARWTTDSHTFADGTFRGDLQPGTLTAQFWDPGHLLDTANKAGAVWATYKPTGATWCWFYDSLTRGLFAPGDPQSSNCVFTGTPWAARLVSENTITNFRSQSASDRLNAIVAALVGQRANLSLPAITGAIANQSQMLPIVAYNTSTDLYPSYLQSVRDAAGNGVAWLAATAPHTDTGPGALVLNYAKWETNIQRILDRSQVVTGPPVTAGVNWIITTITWAATDGNGTQTPGYNYNTAYQQWGYVGPSPIRVSGNLTPGQPEYLPVAATGDAITAAHTNPSELVLSSVALQSGRRTTPTGGLATATWDAYAHTFTPVEVARIKDDAGAAHYYRVTKSDHRLTSTVWETTHYLEKYVAPTPLP